jgi:hypothetical protein
MTQRFYRDYGNGPVCPEAGDHGHMYEIEGRYWCPVTQHLFAIIRGGEVGERISGGALDGNRARGNAPAVKGTPGR